MHIVVYILIGNCARVSTIYLFNRFNSLHLNIVNKCYFCTKIKLIDMIKSNFEYPRKVSNQTDKSQTNISHCSPVKLRGE